MKWVKLITPILLIVAIWSSCSTTRFVQAETVRTDSIYISQVQRDSIYMHDSIYVHAKGDTVVVESFRYIYRDKLVRDTVYVNHTDTISEPYPVEKQLSRWEQMKLELGGLAIGLIIAAVIALAVAAWRRYFL